MDDEEFFSVEIVLENIIANSGIENAAKELRHYLDFLENEILPSSEVSGDYARENMCKGEIEGVKYALGVLNKYSGVDIPDKKRGN